jgi:glycyl-tRNA synthetase beta chain
MERLRSHYLESDAPEWRGVTTEMIDAVLATNPTSPLDIDARLQALRNFLTLPEAASLASANKRIANILRKSVDEVSGAVDTARLEHQAERQLFEHLLSMERAVKPLLMRGEYAAALTQLASLRADVDAFFDGVMVMAEDAELRANRLGLLLRMRSMFLQIADLSRLPG